MNTSSFRRDALNARIAVPLVSPSRFAVHVHSYFAAFPNRKIVHITHKGPSGFEYLL